MMSTNRTDPRYERAYERGILRSAFVSMFWAVFSHRKKTNGLTLQALASAIPANKAEVSRWFKGDPNWTINTIASIANALDVDIKIQAIDRKTGTIFTPAGIQAGPVTHIGRMPISPSTNTNNTFNPRPGSDTLFNPPVVITRLAS